VTEFDQELARLQQAIEENNLQQFLSLGLTRDQLLHSRLKHSLNVLQAVCYYNSERIMKYLVQIFKDDAEAKSDLVRYQEPNGGNMAIHFGVLKGNKRLIDSLIKDFGADPQALTSSGLCVLHCAAQFERGVLSIEYFTQGEFGLNVNFQDKFKFMSLFAHEDSATNRLQKNYQCQKA
jgi:hypothetical protein